MPHFLYFSYSELVYSWLVMLISDWHYDSFCEELLVKHYETVQKREIYGFRHWENEKVVETLRMSLEEVKTLQQKLSEFDTDDRWYFCQFLKGFE